MAPKGSPFLYCYEKGKIGQWKMKGQWWVTSKNMAGGKFEVWMSGMQPDNAIMYAIW